MTSPKILAERQAAKNEQVIFDSLPSAIRDAMNSCEETPPRPSSVLSALLRGVSEESILTLLRRKKDDNPS